MRIDEKLRARVRAVIDEGRQWDLKVSPLRGMNHDRERREALECASGWFASARHLINVLFPDPLNAYRAQVQAANTFISLSALLETALVDIDAGVVTHLMDAARAEVFDDLLDQADHFLRINKVGPAGVTAGVVFEDTVRRACDRLGKTQKGEALEQLIIFLEKGGHIVGVKAKRARAAAAVRTSATHAQWDEFTAGDVTAAIAITRELLGQLLV